MNRTMTLRLLAAAALLSLSSTSAFAIVWGELDKGENPNVGAIVRIPDGDPTQAIAICSGSLIHPQVFLSAGHCTGFMEDLIADGTRTLDDYRVSFADDSRDPRSWIRIVDIITHPGYRPVPDSAGGGPIVDVGVLILEEPVTDIEPVQLAYPGMIDDLADAGLLRNKSQGASFESVGYGSYLEWQPPTILYDEMRRHGISSYQAHNQDWLILSQNLQRGDEGTGYGDSGGPTFWIDPATGDKVVVALTSRGDAMLVATGVAFRIDNVEVAGFLMDVVDFANSLTVQ